MPAILAGSSASATKRAIARRRTGRSFMFPPCVVWSSPPHSGGGAECFGENPMNVQLSRDANRPVLWQRNADWSRRRTTSTPVARTDRTSAIRRKRRLRRGLGIRSFQAALRQSERALHGRLDAAGRAGGPDLPDPPWRAGLRGHLPAPVHPRGRGGHRRSHLQWPARDRYGGGLAPAGARGIGHPLSPDQGARRAFGRSRPGHAIADDDRPGELQGPALPARGRRLPPAPGAKAASANLDRRRRRAAHAPDRRSPGRCLACLRLGSVDGGQVRAARRARREGRARSQADSPIGVPFPLTALGPGAPPSHPAAAGRVRLLDRRVAVRRQGAARRVRREGHARARELAQPFFAAFWRLTLFACLPNAVRVFFGRWATVRFFFAADAAFLMFFRAAARCFSLAISKPPD